MPFGRGDRVRDPVGPDLARILVADRETCLHARAYLEVFGVDVALDELRVGTRELRDGGRDADALDRAEVEEAAVERAELVAGAVTLGRDAPVLG